MTKRTFVLSTLVLAAGALLLLAPAARALDLGGLAGKAADAAGNKARDKAIKDVNAKLLAEGRKNQCSFKTDSDEFAAGCDQKLKNLAGTLVDAKKRLNVAGVTSFKFEVSGHTDSSGKPEHNKELSGKRAAVIERELIARGIAKSEIVAVGMG
jgi:outer membrane protein OmpA-like peptidoglycan-associated protein